MTDPKEDQRESAELELDAETVKDLDVDEVEAEQVAGGTRSTLPQPHDN
jgi:hypothetical protein